MASIISAGTTSGTALNMAGDTSGVLQLATNGTTTAVTIDTSQNVGIGTTSPSSFSTSKLVVNQAADGDIVFARGGSTRQVQLGTSSTVGYINADNTSGGLGLNVNTTERMRIDSSGNVGIGTTSPTFKLDVQNGSGRIYNSTFPALRIQNNSTGTANNDGLLIEMSGSEALFVNYESSNMIFKTADTERMSITSSGSLILAGSTAQKASGTTWSNPSDQRLKDNIRDYTKGTTELMQVRVREWEYNGKGGTTEGLKGLGVVADEVMTVLPNTVETYDAKLNADDEETTAIKKFDATEITWLLVKTVQEQQTIINDLKARITALEGAA
jgi:hypothetical protein